MSDRTLPRTERLRSHGAVARLFENGQSGFIFPFRYVWYAEADTEFSAEVLFNVPKRFHKRANRRNLLRRRTKEAYRLQKGLLCGAAGPAEGVAGPVECAAGPVEGAAGPVECAAGPVECAAAPAVERTEGAGSGDAAAPRPQVNLDLALIYASKEMLPYKTIEHAVRRILATVAAQL